MTAAPLVRQLRTSFMILAPFLSLNSSWAMASSMLIPRICGRQQTGETIKPARGGEDFISLNHCNVRSILHFNRNNNDIQEEMPCAGSHHFGQIPHLVFAVLDLPPAVVDLLQQTNGTLFRYFSQQESTPESWTIWIPPSWCYRCVYKKCVLIQDLYVGIFLFFLQTAFSGWVWPHSNRFFGHIRHGFCKMPSAGRIFRKFCFTVCSMDRAFCH